MLKLLGSDRHADARSLRLFHDQLGKRHVSHALIGILLEERDLLIVGAADPVLPAASSPRLMMLIPRREPLTHRLKQVRLLIHDRLVFQSGDNAVGTADHVVVEFAPRLGDGALLKYPLVAGDNGGDMLARREPGALEHRDVAAGGKTDEVGLRADLFGPSSR